VWSTYLTIRFCFIGYVCFLNVTRAIRDTIRLARVPASGTREFSTIPENFQKPLSTELFGSYWYGKKFQRFESKIRSLASPSVCSIDQVPPAMPDWSQLMPRYSVIWESCRSFVPSRIAAGMSGENGLGSSTTVPSSWMM
jgi:hypothetical protein